MLKLNIINVPGVYEIPIAIRKNIKKFDGFIALGCVIKGQTPHFDLICSSTFNSILNLSINFNKPIGNGIITAYNMKQALQRSKNTKVKNQIKDQKLLMQSCPFYKMDLKKSKNSSPRIKVIQKLYNALMNPDALIEYPKSQYKKFIKDVVTGTLERSDLIEEQIKSFLANDINLTKTDKLLKIILFAAIFELMFKHNTPKKVIINEYLLASEHFLEKIQIGYLNAILDKISKELRKDD